MSVMSTSRCLSCNQSSPYHGDEVNLSIQLGPGSSNELSILIENYFEDECFDRVCPSCQSKISLMERKLTVMPQNLMVQLKRYNGDGQKFLDPVIASTTLSLFSTEYQLRAVISHIGDSLDTGHYNCTIHEKFGHESLFFKLMTPKCCFTRILNT